MKIIFYNNETGENLTNGYYFLDEKGILWCAEFGSCDSVTNPTSLWAGTAGKVDVKFGIKIEE